MRHKAIGVIMVLVLVLSGCNASQLDRISEEEKAKKVISYLETKEKEGVFNGVPLYQVFFKKDKESFMEDIYALSETIYLDYMYAMASGYLDTKEYVDTYNELKYEIATVSDSIEVFWDIETYERSLEETNYSRQYLYSTMLLKLSENYLEEFKNKESKTETERTLRETLASEYNLAIIEGYKYLEELYSSEADKNGLVTTNGINQKVIGIYYNFIKKADRTLVLLNNIALNDLSTNEEEITLKNSNNITIDPVEQEKDIKSIMNYIYYNLEENMDLSTDVQLGRETILFNIYKIYRDYDTSWYTIYNKQYGANEEKLLNLLIGVDSLEVQNKTQKETKDLIVKYYTGNINLSKEVKEIVKQGLNGEIETERVRKIYSVNKGIKKMELELNALKKSLATEK